MRLSDFSQTYDSLYTRGYRRAFRKDEIARYRALKHFITRVIKIDTEQAYNILDYGSGQGLYITLWHELFTRSNLSFCDISRVALKNLTNQYPQYQASALPVEEGTTQFEDQSFDLIFSIEVIEHAFDLQAYFKEMKRLLRPGGLFVWTTPCANKFSTPYILSFLLNQIQKTEEGYRRWQWEDPTHVRRLTSSEISEILEKNDFDLVNIRFGAHFFTYFCMRLMRGPLSVIGEQIMRLDYGLFRRMKNGGTMIGVAQKNV